ncbi:uncharacterized protein LOC141599521 isoform X2 [Silene latifolia]
MANLDPGKLAIKNIVWPGTHDSATKGMGILAECQTLSIYEQLVKGVRVLDVRIQKDCSVCHGLIKGYNVDVVVFDDVKRFLAETVSEIIILEIRTEYGYNDPPEFHKYLVEKLGVYLIPQNEKVFGMTVAQVLPKRVICVWKPRNSAAPRAGSPLWSAGYLRDNWINTDLPHTKFQGNLKNLSEQPPVTSRKFFYRVESTVTPQADADAVLLYFKTLWGGFSTEYASLFLGQCSSKGIIDRLQVFSTDFIQDDFVDACIGLNDSRVRQLGTWSGPFGRLVSYVKEFRPQRDEL